MTSTRADNADGFVYWIASDVGDVKIGWALDPEKRCRELQTGNPQLLRVIAAMQGTKRDERALHAKLEHARGNGEWFDRSAALGLAGELGLEPHNQNRTYAVVLDGWRGALFWTMRQAYNTAEAQGFITYGFGTGATFTGPHTEHLSDKAYADFQRCVTELNKCFQRLALALRNREHYEAASRLAVDEEVRREIKRGWREPGVAA